MSKPLGGTSEKPFGVDLRIVEVDLSGVFPVAYDAGRDRIFGVNELGALEVQQGVVGGCASGRMEDLRQVAMVLDGDHLASGFQLYVVPASREIRGKCSLLPISRP